MIGWLLVPWEIFIGGFTDGVAVVVVTGFAYGMDWLFFDNLSNSLELRIVRDQTFSLIWKTQIFPSLPLITNPRI